jgi:RHS repeat-associated protein
MTTSLGAKCYDADYTPYGKEIAVYVNTCPQNYKFTGKERDGESGLDYFGARFFSSNMGRFSTADPLLNSGHPSDPQSWNRYTYTLNNPLKFIDPTGLYNLKNNCNQNDKKCNKQFAKNAEKLKKGLEKLQKQLAKVKNPLEKARLERALDAIGKENDGNNVNVSFGATKGGGAAEIDPHPDQAGTSYASFDVTFDPAQLSSIDDYAIAGAHEGTHVDDYNTYMLNPNTAMEPFQIEYRGYQTSAWAASALGYSSLSPQYGGKSYPIWNRSWGRIDDATLTKLITSFKDKNGQQTHPEKRPHNPHPN